MSLEVPLEIALGLLLEVELVLVLGSDAQDTDCTMDLKLYKRYLPRSMCARTNLFRHIDPTMRSKLLALALEME